MGNGAKESRISSCRERSREKSGERGRKSGRQCGCAESSTTGSVIARQHDERIRGRQGGPGDGPRECARVRRDGARQQTTASFCGGGSMLAPIITKDMKLFPTRPLPAGIKNVRSRAQSLDQFNQVQNSGSSRGRIIPVKPRSSQSAGNLPAVAASASFSRSPPKASVHRKTTLTAIQEGVEMSHSHVPVSRQMESRSESKLPTDAVHRSTRKPKKYDKENETAMNGHCTSVGSTSSSDSAMVKKEKKGVVKWLTSAFRRSREKDLSDTSSSNSS